MEAVKSAANTLKRHYAASSLSLSAGAGCEIFYQFVSSLRDAGSVLDASFDAVLLAYVYLNRILKGLKAKLFVRRKNMHVRHEKSRRLLQITFIALLRMIPLSVHSYISAFWY